MQLHTLDLVLRSTKGVACRILHIIHYIILTVIALKAMILPICRRIIVVLNWLIYLLIEEVRTKEITQDRVTFFFVIPLRNS